MILLLFKKQQGCKLFIRVASRWGSNKDVNDSVVWDIMPQDLSCFSVGE
jgi:hypothetical protein